MAMALPQVGLLDCSSEGPSSAMSPTSIIEIKQFYCSALTSVPVGAKSQAVLSNRDAQLAVLLPARRFLP